LATAEEIQSANTESIRVASEVTISLLSYNPATVDADLRAAETQLTGTFREAYSSLVDDVVIPGARQKQISSTAAVPAASLVSASRNRAMVMVFVDQTTIVGSDAPTRSASSIRVTLDKVDGRWLISDFTPIR
jgi:Mce-associated membrane protein